MNKLLTTISVCTSLFCTLITGNGADVSLNKDIVTPSFISSAVTDDRKDTPIGTDASTNGTKISGNVITVSVPDGSDISTTLDGALKTARNMADKSNKIITVKVKPGSYDLSKALHIYSNTTLILTDVTLTSKGTKKFNMILSGTSGKYKGRKNYAASSLCRGYKGFKNITIKGGTLIGGKKNKGSLVRIYHATNVTLDGVTVSGGAGVHQMEICAINGLYIKNCTFRDAGKSADDIDNHTNEEALQLDIPCCNAVYPGVYQDGTPMKNVEITGCTFKNVSRGLGTHTLLFGAYHENIKINNNYFENVLEECIIGLNYYNCEIKDNNIVNCGGGIMLHNFKPVGSSMNTTIFDGKKKWKGKFRYNLKTTISGNKIQTRYAPTCTNQDGIKIYGYKQTKPVKCGDGTTIPAGNYYISGVKVTNNTITASGNGIHLLDARNCTVTNNVIIGKNFSSKDPDKNKKDGIFIENYSKNLKITNNKVKNMTRTGLYIQTSSFVSKLENNSFKNCGVKGIHIYKNSGTTGPIYKNTISGCKMGGILISTDSSVTSIKRNTITGCSGDAGILIYKNSKSGAISGNTIANMGKFAKNIYCAGIKLSTKSTSGSISGNTIKKTAGTYSAGRGIMIFNGSTVKGSISNNIISNTSESGISLSQKATVTGNITTNTISRSGRNGIEVANSSKVKKEILRNTILEAKTKGIIVSAKSTVGIGINENTITGSKEHGINLYSALNDLSISGNTISDGSNIPLIVRPESNIYNITINNNIITAKESIPGLRVVNGKVVITGNTISNVSYGIIADASASGEIYSNIINKYTKAKYRIAGNNVKLTD